MITKKRLEELIALNKPFWYVYDSNILKTINAKYWRIVDNKICWYADSSLYRSFETLFENKEDAEWWLQYGNIQRTETLSLPSWEEMQKRFENNTKFGGHLIVEFDDIQLMVFIDNYSRKFIELNGQPRKLLTKENYIDACRLAKKLFLGENNERN